MVFVPSLPLTSFSSFFMSKVSLSFLDAPLITPFLIILIVSYLLPPFVFIFLPWSLLTLVSPPPSFSYTSKTYSPLPISHSSFHCSFLSHPTPPFILPITLLHSFVFAPLLCPNPSHALLSLILYYLALNSTLLLFSPLLTPLRPYSFLCSLSLSLTLFLVSLRTFLPSPFYCVSSHSFTSLISRSLITLTTFPIRCSSLSLP